MAPLFGRQTTLADTLSIAGRGLHTGAQNRVRIAPGAPDAGIIFRRTKPGAQPIELRAEWRHRVQQHLCTALVAPDGTLFRTVEHLLAALSALGIDNAVIDLTGEELPILDGSALPWCSALLAAGIAEQPRPRRYLRVLEPLELARDDRAIRMEPGDGRFVSVRMDLRGFGEMSWSGEVDPATFVRELAPARSFGRLKWALPAKLYSLFTRKPVLRGANLSNVAAVWGDRVIGGMRLPDEPARHRALDLIGDLALAGVPILGRVTAHRPCHDINYEFLALLMERRDLWTYVDAPPAGFAASSGAGTRPQ
jgi:UDP-3-O-[3-hydroxymyristoyl] N-acetylglucosamine deacetylase